MGSRYPFSAFPNGWFVVAESAEVPAAGVAPLRYFGQELVIFRPAGGTPAGTAGGAPAVLDAYCPHLGAHLGYGGKVEDGCIRCPFHAWRFDGGGACVEVPYARKIPPRAQVRSWPVREQNGLIAVFHHAGGQPPDYEVPLLPEYGAPDWTPFRQKKWRVRTHCQEIAENVADVAHQRFLHRTGVVPEVQEARESERVFHLRTRMTGLKAEVTLHGLGAEIFRGRMNLGAGAFDCLDAIFTTPIDEEYVETRHVLSVKRRDTEEATRAIEEAWARTAFDGVDDDVRIWDNKIFRSPPVLCDGDGPIGLFRRWARQFYSETTTQQRSETA